MEINQQNYYIINFIISLKSYLFGSNKINVKPGSISPLISKKINSTTWIIHNVTPNNYVDL